MSQSKRVRSVSRRPTILSSESVVQQSFKKECDINVIMKKAQRSGELPQFNPGSFGDFTSYDDYHHSCNKVLAAQESFLELPSKIRTKFDNDPGRFLEFVSNPDNRDELIALGLANEPSDNRVVTEDNIIVSQENNNQVDESTKGE
jgi:phage internal scaffolding protein